MNKRGQVFILAAIMIAVILFSLAAVRNKSEQEEIKGDFEALSENFKVEASKLINSVIKTPSVNAHEAFKSFSTMFMSYAKGKNPEYGLIYILGFGDKIQVTNFLERTINVQGCRAGGRYNITIPGGFKEISAGLNFSGFDIKVDIQPAGLEFECENITLAMLEGVQPITDPENHGRFCAFIYPGGLATEIEMAIIVDGAPYVSCVKKGVPELMQVGIMKQGRQAKVSATGDCISKNFCEGFNQQDCISCGGAVCFWWAYGGGGLCLSNYSDFDKASGKCVDGDQLCYLNKIYYYDTCGNPISQVPGSDKDCTAINKVCRDKTDDVDPTKCCTKQESKECCGNNVCWLSSCDTPEGPAEDCQGGVCHDDTNGLPSGTEAECCIKDDHTGCSNNDIYKYDKCPASGISVPKTSPEVECNEVTNWLCRDSTNGLPPGADAKCCQQNFEKKCDNNDLYWFDSCGIKGDLAEDCVNCDVANKKCCVQNYEKKCYNNDLYWFDSCGIKGDLAEDCVLYCQVNKCCINQGKVCSDDYKYICDNYGDCGKKDCNTDCSAEGKVCVCDSDGCKCKNKGYIFTCRRYYTATDCGDCPSCSDGWTPSGDCWDYDDCDCWLFWCDTEYAQSCYQDYQTDCLISPSCQDHETKVGEETCSNPSG